MTKPCIVPKCKTGYKSVKQKTSVFKVPKDSEMRKKWMLAIPKICVNDVFYVCELHFEKKFLKKQCVMYNEKGDVIFKRDYERPQLQPGAYPTIFNNVSETVNDCSMDDVPCAERSYATNDLISEALQLPKDQERDQEHVHNVDQDRTLVDNCSDLNMEVDIEHPSVNEDQGCEPQMLTAADMETQPETKILRIIDKISVGYSSEVSAVSIPWSWTASEAIIDNKHHVIFSHVISRRSAIPTLTKAVTIDKTGKIEYSVHGRKLEPNEGSGFPLQLENCEDVPAILLQFEKRRACKGVILSGNVNVQLSAIFESSDGVWHSKDCTLITKGRKCVACKDLLQRINRSKRRAINKLKVLRAKQLHDEKQRKLCVAKKAESLKKKLEKKCDELRTLVKTKIKECRNVSQL
uniref:THAP-type domain-containing protein n=2 Tax=Photinus pyralis TaxID=7054 RepID=A0A1Y1MXE3_PHOPY